MNKILLKPGEPLQFSQLAILNPFDQELNRANYYDFSPVSWVEDVVQADNVAGILAGTSFTARLRFNYDIVPGMEFELLTLLEGRTGQVTRESQEGMSHMGVHVTDIEAYIEAHPWLHKRPLLQISETQSHTGTNRRYRYALIDTTAELGFVTKLIQRRL